MPMPYSIIPDNFPTASTGKTFVPIISQDGEFGVDFETGEQLFFPSEETIAQSAQAIAVTVAVDRVYPAREFNTQISSVAENLLGYSRAEGQQQQYAIVNTYSLDPREFSVWTEYSYTSDPPNQWQIEPSTNQGDYGVIGRHLPQESCVQCYTFPPPLSFPWPDFGSAPTGYFPGGNNNGIMRARITSTRAIRYQPGKISKVTLGIKARPQKNGILRWGCRNESGDGYWYEIDDNRLYFVYSNRHIQTKSLQNDWNVDSLLGDRTSWILDPDNVTMYQFEFGWYGAIGCRSTVYIPVGATGESRWVRTHAIDWQDPNSSGQDHKKPILSNPFLRVFVESDAVAGINEPQFINLYGSSAYIDGGDRGTRSTELTEVTKPIDSVDKVILGIQAREFFESEENTETVLTPNQKAAYPITLSVFSSVDATLRIYEQLPLRSQNQRDEINYGYGLSKIINCTFSEQEISSVSIDQSRTILSGNFSGVTVPDIGIKVEGPSLFKVFIVEKISNNSVRLNRSIPSSIQFPTTIRLNPYNSTGRSIQAIPSGVEKGSISAVRTGETRIGLWPSNGRNINQFSRDETAWGVISEAVVNFNAQREEIGEYTARNPIINSQEWEVTSEGLRFGDKVVPFLGHPIYIVFEATNGSIISDPACQYFLNGESVNFDIDFDLVNATVTNPPGGEYSLPNFKPHSPQSGVLIDTQCTQELRSPTLKHTFFVQANNPQRINLTSVFGFEKEFISQSQGIGKPAFFFNAQSPTPGSISLALRWEETA
jgi:hypothetical protein